MLTTAYLSLADAASYCGRSGSPSARARWARRKFLGHIPHYEIPNSGIVFRRQDIDEYMAQYRIDPLEQVDRAVKKVEKFLREERDNDSVDPNSRKAE